jgi:hypothetical protein
MVPADLRLLVDPNQKFRVVFDLAAPLLRDEAYSREPFSLGIFWCIDLSRTPRCRCGDG